MLKPKIVDNDHNIIRIELDGNLLQQWFYLDEDERREKMRNAWYFCDGFLAAIE